MTLKNILVGYNGNESSDFALKLAMAIAAKRDAHLTGVFARGVPRSVEAADAWLTNGLGEQFRAMAERVQNEILDAVEERFRTVSADAQTPGKVHWIGLKGLADDAVSRIARSFDLTVIGKYSPSEHGAQVDLHPDIIALKSGKPVIVVPELTGAPKLCDNVVVAWDGQRASAKATSDLLQILPPISRITLLRIGAEEAPDAATKRMLTHIERHGVEGSFVTRPRGKSIAHSLIDGCDALSATLLVMGAYEHSKFGEDLFGGVTNDVLKMLKKPVLMSH